MLGKKLEVISRRNLHVSLSVSAVLSKTVGSQNELILVKSPAWSVCSLEKPKSDGVTFARES